MTIFELLIFVFFVGGGALAAHNIGQLAAPAHAAWFTASGAIVGLFLPFGFGWLAEKFDDWPHCRCGGKLYEDFDLITQRAGYEFIHQCNKCGCCYVMRKGFLWFEMLEDDSTRLFLKRGFLGKWRQTAENEIANRRYKRAVAPRRARVG